MSLVGDSLTAALAAINNGLGGPTVEWRAGTSGAWTDMVLKCHFHRDEAGKDYSDERYSEALTERATLLVPEAGAILAFEYQVRLNADDADIWSIEEGPTAATGQRRYGLVRRTSGAGQPNRGRLEQ